MLWCGRSGNSDEVVLRNPSCGSVESDEMPFATGAYARRHDETPKYFLAQTKPNCESYAAGFLKADRFNVYFPRVRARRAHAGRIDYVARPLFAGYLFVEDDGARGPFYFRSMPGISSVVGFGAPVRVPAAIIDKIRAREETDGLIRLEDGGLKHGDRVRLPGALAEFEAIFDCKLPRERARVLLRFLTRSVRVVIGYDDLEKVS